MIMFLTSFTFLTALTLTPSPWTTASPPTNTVTIAVDGLHDDQGQVVVRLFASRDGFPRNGDKAAHTGTAEIKGGAAEVSFTDLPAGTYAAIAFHDADGDGELKTNRIGMPKEGIGASNWTGGRPTFKKSAFTLDDTADVRLPITVQYR